MPMPKFSLTTKGSSRQTSRNRRVRRVLLVAAVSLFLLLIVPRLVGGISAAIMTPVISLESITARFVRVLPIYFQDRHELLKEITVLEATLAREQSSSGTVGRLTEENRELRALLADVPEERIAAGVIGRPTATPYDVLVLDHGSNDGVVVSAPVYIGADQVIGYVAEVFPNTAVVALATTPGFESTVYIFGPNIYTTAEGVGGGVLEVRVPQGILMNVGDTVVLPALGAGVFGAISVVDSIPTEPEQRGYVTLEVPLHSVRLVSVGTEALTPVSFAEAKTVIENMKDSLLTVPVPEGVLVDVIDDIATTSSSTAPIASTTQSNI